MQYKSHPPLGWKVSVVLYHQCHKDQFAWQDKMSLILSEAAFSFWFTSVFLTVKLRIFLVKNFCWSNLPKKLTFLTFYSFILGKTILNSSKFEVTSGINSTRIHKKDSRMFLLLTYLFIKSASMSTTLTHRFTGPLNC